VRSEKGLGQTRIGIYGVRDKTGEMINGIRIPTSGVAHKLNGS